MKASNTMHKSYVLKIIQNWDKDIGIYFVIIRKNLHWQIYEWNH